MDPNTVSAIASVASAVAALAALWMAIRNERSVKRLEFLAGALESHSFLRVRIAAKLAGIPVEAYDPSVNRYPGRSPQAGKEWPMDKVYAAIPPDLRREPPED